MTVTGSHQDNIIYALLIQTEETKISQEPVFKFSFNGANTIWGIACPK